MQIGSFALETLGSGVLKIVFSRPPVNAVSLSVYEDLGKIAELVEGDDAIKALVLTAPNDARAWCGGADLNDFKGIDKAGRMERYAFINQQLPRFHAIDRPIIAAINGAAVGVGMVLASLCDFRVAAENAPFSLPEIDYGLLSGCAGRFVALRLPEPKLREMLYTGRKFTAREIEGTGFFNYILPKHQVLDKAIELASQVAAKDSAIMRARKANSLDLEGSDWFEAYLSAQRTSSQFVGSKTSRKSVDAVLGTPDPR